MTSPDITVVIPTRDRRAALERTLGALARQRLAASRFEVVVATDGGAEVAQGLLAALELPYAARVVPSAAGPNGAAAARNRGAAAARAELLVFLDDDIESSPDLLTAHLRAHRDGAQATVGYLPPFFEGGAVRFFQIALRGWWEAMFEAMRSPGHRYWFRDLLTGNFAIAASRFGRLGGFDSAFRCHEDYEFGVRLIEQGVTLRFAERASGLHHDRTTLDRALERKRDEGIADIDMLQKHPELASSLPLGAFDRYASRMQRLLRRLVFERPRAGQALARLITGGLPAFERARLRGRWTRRLNDVLSYWYWRGVAERIPTLAAYASFVERCAVRSRWSPGVLEVDLANGLDLVLARVDHRRPDGLRVTFNGRSIGDIPPVPGAEGLTGEHLRSALARELAGRLLAALGQAGTIPVGTGPRGLEATGWIPRTTVRL